MCFRFPLKFPDLLEQWVKAINRKHFIPTLHSLICSQHFKAEDYSESTLSKKRLKRDAVPSVFNFPKYLQTSSRKPTKLERVYPALSPHKPEVEVKVK